MGKAGPRQLDGSTKGRFQRREQLVRRADAAWNREPETGLSAKIQTGVAGIPGHLQDISETQSLPRRAGQPPLIPVQLWAGGPAGPDCVPFWTRDLRSLFPGRTARCGQGWSLTGFGGSSWRTPPAPDDERWKQFARLQNNQLTAASPSPL